MPEFPKKPEAGESKQVEAIEKKAKKKFNPAKAKAMSECLRGSPEEPPKM